MRTRTACLALARAAAWLKSSSVGVSFFFAASCFFTIRAISSRSAFASLALFNNILPSSERGMIYQKEKSPDASPGLRKFVWLLRCSLCESSHREFSSCQVGSRIPPLSLFQQNAICPVFVPLLPFQQIYLI